MTILATKLITLIFIHGGPGLPDYLSQVFQDDFSSPSGTRVEKVFYTQSQADRHGMEDYLDELHGHVERAKGDVYLVGHSWGGMIASEYVFRRKPASVRGLILIASAYSSAYKGKGAKLLDPETLKKNPFASALTEEEVEAHGLRVILWMLKMNKPLYGLINEAYISRFDNEDNFRNSRLPLLNIYGDSDYVIVTDHQRRLGQLNSAVTTNVEIKGAGHMPFLLDRHHDQVVQSITSFVTEHSR